MVGAKGERDKRKDVLEGRTKQEGRSLEGTRVERGRLKK